MNQNDQWAQDSYTAERKAYWNRVALEMEQWQGMGAYYHQRLEEIYRFIVPPQSRVLEIGCGDGNLLAAVDPAMGVGIDLAPEMIARARRLHPDLRFMEEDAHFFELNETFDYVIVSDLVNDLWDVQRVFQQIRRVTAPRSRIVLNVYSRLWEIPRMISEKVGWARSLLDQNWLTVEDLASLLHLTDFEMIRSWQEILWPIRTPVMNGLCNRFLVRLWPFRIFALTNFMIARPAPEPIRSSLPKVSVIVPARNEAGNIDNIMDRTPHLGRGTELIFVEGGSTDNSYEVTQQSIAAHPELDCKVFRQTGVGKGDAVRLGFEKASGDVLMILDADLTVPPEELPRFLEAWMRGKGEFINGVRLVYPMEGEAMRTANLWGNKFFSLAFSWLLGQPIKDTLCGTKVLSREAYQSLAANRSYFGEFDPFGDFDLIFGAAKLNLKMVDLPIRYRARVYGDTNISRWRHGLILLRMTLYAMGRIKFV